MGRYFETRNKEEFSLGQNQTMVGFFLKQYFKTWNKEEFWQGEKTMVGLFLKGLSNP